MLKPSVLLRRKAHVPAQPELRLRLVAQVDALAPQIQRPSKFSGLL